MSRHTATPDVARELTRVWYETDVRDVLPAVQVPTLILEHDGEPADVELARWVASSIPGARLVLLRGIEATAQIEPIVDEVRSFLGVERRSSLATVLATVLFTDIVGSTERQASLGDRRWRDLLEAHHRIVRDTLARWGGTENDTAGDGFYATFDGPARAIRCALEIGEAVRTMGIEIRAGIHTGECELFDGKHTGIAVTIGARVSALAGPSEVLVSRTVKDLVAGSGLAFEDVGEHELKGVPSRWQLYRVAS